jgi:hypothetical protein
MPRKGSDFGISFAIVPLDHDTTFFAVNLIEPYNGCAGERAIVFLPII